LSPRPIEFPVEGLTDGVVRLRLGSDADVEAITALVQDPEINRWTTIPAGQKAAQTREWLHRGMAGMATGTDLSLVIADAGTDRPLGTIGLHELNRATNRVVCGYVLAAAERRKGYGARALRLLCRFAFDELRVERIEAAIEPENAASRATAEKVGFREEGLMRSYMSIAGRRRDLLMYSLLPGEIDSGSGA
jgi:[ribosomal protein S5]-alanine N-acetyltransferase